MSMVLEEYKKMQTKFGLPEYTMLKSMFHLPEEFYNIDQVRSEISSKLFDFSEKIVEPLIFCNGSCHMIERSMLTKTDSEEMFHIYKRIQALRWRNHWLSVKPDKTETVKLIKDMWMLWQEFEPSMARLCKKMSDGWSDLRFKTESTEYHG